MAWPKIARIAVRPDENKDRFLILGLTHPDIFKPGKVYEIIEILGCHIIKEIGESAASLEKNGVAWSRDVNGIVIDGNHLRTVEEYKRRESLAEEADLNYMGFHAYLDKLAKEGKLK